MQGIIWCPPPSQAARALSRALGWPKLRRVGGQRRRLEPLLASPGGCLLLYPPTQELLTILPTWRRLNDRFCWDKLLQHTVLKGAGIPTLDVLSYAPNEEWIPRTRHHAGGGDFLQTIEPDYFTRRVEVEKEFRFHIIEGRSVKGGGKIALPGAHQWVRARQFGWVVDYGPRGREGMKASHRELAKEAAAALQMDAGVVDVWQLHDGRAIVGEVNVRPGMDAPTVQAWADALRRVDGDSQ